MHLLRVPDLILDAMNGPCDLAGELRRAATTNGPGVMLAVSWRARLEIDLSLALYRATGVMAIRGREAHVIGPPIK